MITIKVGNGRGKGAAVGKIPKTRRASLRSPTIFKDPR
jgi:hypothetical protein